MTVLKVVNRDQLQSALKFWIRDAQRLIVPKISKYHGLKPVLDPNTGILRLNGRFGNHPDGYHPIFLAHDHPFVRLLVASIHDRSHCGTTSIAAKVRNEYHVLGVRSLAKEVRQNCTTCRELAKNLIEVPMAPLPIERFRPTYAFEFCSCDLFGPFPLKVPGRVTRGRPMDSYGSKSIIADSYH